MNSKETAAMVKLLEEAIDLSGGGFLIRCSKIQLGELAKHILKLDDLANGIGLSVDRYKVGDGEHLLTRCSDCGGVLESEWPNEPVTNHEEWCMYKRARELTGRRI